MSVGPLDRLKSHIAGCVVSADPLITVSRRETGLPFGIVSAKPEALQRRPSLHFIALTHSCEIAGAAASIAADLETARAEAPLARIVLTTSTLNESVALSRAGVPNIFANELIFVDERQFAPRPLIAPRFDAVYLARLHRMKRHDLAKALSSLLLVYGQPDPGEAERVKKLLPRATFANHEANGGAYAYFKKRQISELLGQCAVGLCLSPEEGAMRASIEYRFSGLPVVSTHSIGGRDRYLLGPHVRIVADDPDAVARAVRELKAQQFDPLAVREYAGRLIAFDRRNFLSTVNKVAEYELGVCDAFRSFAPFIGLPATWRPRAQVLAPLDEQRP